MPEVKAEFAYYNLSKPPNLRQKRPLPADKDTKETKETKEEIDERLQGIEPRLIELIRNEIMHKVDSITWEKIAGLEHAKKTIFEIVIWPMLRPYPLHSLIDQL
jgi:SpoVK/Ycf46/Vps4 family AAA+-type ATPase